MRQIFQFIHGQHVESVQQHVIYNPATSRQIAKVHYADTKQVNQAVASAEIGFEIWSETPSLARSKVLFKFRDLIDQHLAELAELISEEHGKSIVESKGSILRGLEVVEFACGIPAHLQGEFSENIARHVDVYSFRQPLGVCVGITPFNFPGMIPLWIGAIAMACGNSFILKPSEKDPSCALLLAELAQKAGFPDGVFNVINGGADVVNTLLEHKDVNSISFVGQTTTAQYIQKRAIEMGKRVQAFGGAKNHMIVMPDANLDKAVEAVFGAAYGSAGERCMAISVIVAVGDVVADKMVEKLKPMIENLKIGSYKDPTADMGPIISPQHRENILKLISKGIEEGATLVVDGRDFKHPDHPDGYYLGGCLFDQVTPEMEIYSHEIFGPVLCIVRVKSYEEALQLPSEHQYGNGVAIFTQDGDCARDFVHRVQVGMVGVNVPVPVPVATHSFGGWKDSAFTDVGMHGMEGVRFFTKLKTVTSRWPSGIREGIEFSLPTTEKIDLQKKK